MKKASRWIDFIEAHSGPYIRNEEKLEYLVNLWKFAEAYSKGTRITPEGHLAIAGEETAAVNFYIPDMAKLPKSNHFTAAVKAAEAAIAHKPGTYTIVPAKQPENFTRERLENFKNELIACLNGSLKLYRYISTLHRSLTENTRIYTNLTVKDVSREIVLDALNATNLKTTSSQNWLVLLLDNFKSKCDYFYIEDTVLHLPFLSGYKKIFVFDFFKGELTELKAQQDTLVI